LEDTFESSTHSIADLHRSFIVLAGRACRQDRWLAARGADFDDDDGAQGEVSENPVGKDAVSGILCQREAVRRGATAFVLKPGLDLCVHKPNSFDASLKQDLKSKFRLVYFGTSPDFRE